MGYVQRVAEGGSNSRLVSLTKNGWSRKFSEPRTGPWKECSDFVGKKRFRALARCFTS